MDINPSTLTDWILTTDQPPLHIGEYNASVSKYGLLLRWWNGEYWSEPYRQDFSDIAKQHLRRKRSGVSNHSTYYRGLRVKPRVYSIHYLRPLK